jgi:type II secretory ATPase GspE/PulE/Tfp pilus assembly ATPase PilB-like protein
LTGLTLARAGGCSNCGNSGFRGRIGFHELLECTPKIKGYIKNRVGDTTDLIREQAALDGMTTLKQDGILKVLQGLTDIHEVLRVCIK